MADLRLAAIAEREGRLDEALSYYLAAVQATPKSPRALGQLAAFYADRLHDPAKAVDYGKMAHELAPDDPHVTQELSRFTYLAKDYLRAYTLGQESVRGLPNDPEALYQFSVAAYGVGRVAEAQQVAERALQTSQSFSSAGAARQLIEMISLSADLARACAKENYIQQLVGRDPQYIPGLMVLGCLREQGGDDRAAAEVFERVLGIDPEFAPATRHLAVLYAERLGEDRKALELGARAPSLFAEDADLAKLLGLAAMRLKDFSRAADFLGQAADHHSQDPTLYYQLGLAYRSLNQKERSKENLEKALALKLDAASSQNAKRLLSEAN
jgi:tetratricopeptide (TPR) repeat protein